MNDTKKSNSTNPHQFYKKIIHNDTKISNSDDPPQFEKEINLKMNDTKPVQSYNRNRFQN